MRSSRRRCRSRRRRVGATEVRDGGRRGARHHPAVMRYNAMPPLTGMPALSVPCGFSDGRAADRDAAHRPRVRRGDRAAARPRLPAAARTGTCASPRAMTRSLPGRRVREAALLDLLRRWSSSAASRRRCSAVPARRGVRLDAPLHRAGGRQRRRRRAARRARWVACHLPRPRARAGARHEPAGFLDELLGRATGICGGRAGSMNVVDLAARARSAASASSAAASPPRPARRCAAAAAAASRSAFFGDGAVNQAYFHECLNFARVMRLPGAVRVREQRLRRVHADGGRRRRAASSRARARWRSRPRVDGKDVWAVRAAAEEAFERMRGGDGPALPRGADLPLLRPRPGRPVKYRPDGRGRGAGTSATRWTWPAPG